MDNTILAAIAANLASQELAKKNAEEAEKIRKQREELHIPNEPAVEDQPPFRPIYIKALLLAAALFCVVAFASYSAFH
jgi:hypothetical protein